MLQVRPEMLMFRTGGIGKPSPPRMSHLLPSTQLTIRPTVRPSKTPPKAPSRPPEVVRPASMAKVPPLTPVVHHVTNSITSYYGCNFCKQTFEQEQTLRIHLNKCPFQCIGKEPIDF